MTGIEACFIGRLGRDAELKHVKGGTMPLLSFTAAVDQRHQGDGDVCRPCQLRIAGGAE